MTQRAAILVTHIIGSKIFTSPSEFDKPACLIVRLLFGFVSDSVFVRLNQNNKKI